MQFSRRTTSFFCVVVFVCVIPGAVFAAAQVPAASTSDQSTTASCAGAITNQKADGVQAIKQSDDSSNDTVTVKPDGTVQVTFVCGTPPKKGTVTMCFFNGRCYKCTKGAQGCSTANAASQANAESDPSLAAKDFAKQLASDAIQNSPSWQTPPEGMAKLLNDTYAHYYKDTPPDQAISAKYLDTVDNQALKAIAAGNFDALPVIAKSAQKILLNPDFQDKINDPNYVATWIPTELVPKANQIIDGLKRLAAFRPQQPPADTTFGNTPLPPSSVYQGPSNPPGQDSSIVHNADGTVNTGATAANIHPRTIVPPPVVGGTTGSGSSDQERINAILRANAQVDAGGGGLYTNGSGDSSIFGSLSSGLSGIISSLGQFLQKTFGSSSSNTTAATTPVQAQPILTIIAQPTTTSIGKPYLLTWSAVNVSQSPSCTLVDMNGQLVRSGNNGSVSLQSANPAVQTYRLTCMPLTGATNAAAAHKDVQVRVQ